MKERPIIFKDEMVRAILEGRKTQTRRLVKAAVAETGERILYFGKVVTLADYFEPDQVNVLGETFGESAAKHAPLGQPGDRLWVRETWHDNYQWLMDNHGFCEADLGQYLYRATISDSDLATMKERGQKWTPSIFMPRWASRLTLEITNVRVEQLQSISEEDVYNEGVGDMIEDPGTIAGAAFNEAEHYLIAGVPSKHIAEIWGFAAYWDSVNAKRGYSWESNPWVWVYEFKVVSE